MTNPSLPRRQWLTGAGAALAGTAGALASPAMTETTAARWAPPKARFCLNMSTIRGQKLSVVEQVELAAAAGYDAIEPWIGELRAWIEQGGSAKDLAKRISDHGLAVASAIGFAEWIVDDDARRAKGLEQAQRDMELVRSLGGTHLAAPPAGAQKETGLNLYRAAERFRALVELGVRMECLPQLEVWGFSTTLSKLGETLLVAAEAKHPQSCLLLDVYHLYKGGSEFAGLQLLHGAQMHCFHMNDYPADPPRETIADKNRVYPGDGVAPLGEILRTLYGHGFAGYLSLELFNPDYWSQPAAQVAKTGLEKMRSAVAQALGAA